MGDEDNVQNGFCEVRIQVSDRRGEILDIVRQAVVGIGNSAVHIADSKIDKKILLVMAFKLLQAFYEWCNYRHLASKTISRIEYRLTSDGRK